MSGFIAPPSHRAAAIRIFGTTGALLAALLAAVLVARPEMLTMAMHAVMGMAR